MRFSRPICICDDGSRHLFGEQLLAPTADEPNKIQMKKCNCVISPYHIEYSRGKTLLKLQTGWLYTFLHLVGKVTVRAMRVSIFEQNFLSKQEKWTQFAPKLGAHAHNF